MFYFFNSFSTVSRHKVNNLSFLTSIFFVFSSYYFSNNNHFFTHNYYFNLLTLLLSTVHAARILQSPPTPRFFMSADSYSLSRYWAESTQRCDQLNCPLILVILKPRGVVAVVRRGTQGEVPLVQYISSSGLATKTLIFLIWEQIMQQVTNQSNDCQFQCTFHRGRHYVHVCMVNNLTDPWFSIYNVHKCEVERKTCNPV